MRPLLISAILLLSPAIARAEIAVGQTAEWLAHSSDLIAQATPLEVQITKGPGKVWFTQVRYRLDAVLKGAATSGDVLTIYDHSFQADPLDLTTASKNGRSILVFASVAKNRFREIDGKFVLTLQNQPRSAFFVDEAIKELYTPDSQRLTRSEELIDRVRKQVQREEEFYRVYPGGDVKRESREAPWDSPAHKDLYSRSAVYVWVPSYDSRR